VKRIACWSVQSISQRRFEEDLAILEKQIECKEDNGCIREQVRRNFAAAETFLDGREGQNTIREGDDFAVEHDPMTQRTRRGFELREPMRHVVERP